MASQEKIIEMIYAVKTMYPYYAKNNDEMATKILIKTWTSLLKEYPDNAVEMAFYKCLQTCKMPPTPADVIEVIKSTVRSTEPTPEELWTVSCEMMKKASYFIAQFGHTYIDGRDGNLTQGEQARKKVSELWNSLPEKIRMYFADEREFIRRSRELEFTDYERDRFLKAMPIMDKRQEYRELMLESPELRLMIE